MSTKAIKIINKEQGFLLDSNREGKEVICVVNPEVAKTETKVTDTQKWLITDEGLITTLDGSQALTFQPPYQVNLQPIKQSYSQKWALNDQGILKCRLNYHALETIEDYIEQELPDFSETNEFSDNVVCDELHYLSDEEQIEPCQQWELRYIDDDQLCNDLLKPQPLAVGSEPTPDYSIKKLEPLPPAAQQGEVQTTGTFDALPPDYYPEPRLKGLKFYSNRCPISYVPQLFWQELSVDIPEICNDVCHLLSLGDRDDTNTEANAPDKVDDLRREIALEKHFTKITGVWIHAETTQGQRLEFSGFHTLKFEANDGSYLEIPSSSPLDKVAVGDSFQLLTLPAKLLEKQLVTLEAPEGCEIVGLHGTYTTFAGDIANAPLQQRSAYQYFLLNLGIYVRQASNFNPDKYFQAF
ncbi:MAG: hypothetical protein F6J86_28015 [Symploca sp. SIO1B1]|nr:hypothetical protein [Symploca sp. SIO1B1]